MFKGLALLLAGMLAVSSLSGCGATKEWIITQAKETAINVVDKQIEKLNEKTIAPKFAEIEGKLGQIDVDGDGEFSKEELESKIKDSVKDAVAGLTEAVKADNEKSLAENLKDYAKGDNVQYLLYLVVAWILSSLGWGVGPKGIKGLRHFLEKRKEKTVAKETVDLS